jgi:hypothetical protein
VGRRGAGGASECECERTTNVPNTRGLNVLALAAVTDSGRTGCVVAVVDVSVTDDDDDVESDEDDDVREVDDVVSGVLAPVDVDSVSVVVIVVLLDVLATGVADRAAMMGVVVVAAPFTLVTGVVTAAVVVAVSCASARVAGTAVLGVDGDEDLVSLDVVTVCVTVCVDVTLVVVVAAAGVAVVAGTTTTVAVALPPLTLLLPPALDTSCAGDVDGDSADTNDDDADVCDVFSCTLV